MVGGRKSSRVCRERSRRVLPGGTPGAPSSIPIAGLLMVQACANVASVRATRRIAVIPGDGIGKEVIPQAVKVMEAAGAAVELTSFDWGADRYLADKVTVPPDGFATLARDFDAILVGAFGDPRVPSN